MKNTPLWMLWWWFLWFFLCVYLKIAQLRCLAYDAGGANNLNKLNRRNNGSWQSRFDNFYSNLIAKIDLVWGWRFSKMWQKRISIKSRLVHAFELNLQWPNLNLNVDLNLSIFLKFEVYHCNIASLSKRK